MKLKTKGTFFNLLKNYTEVKEIEMNKLETETNVIEIKRHNFDSAINRIKEFSEKTEAELEIDKVRTSGGLFDLFDHQVTGYELNNRLETIQNHFIAVNTTNNKVIKEFREVYNALDSLDKDYIASIVANVKAIEKTSNDVRKQQKALREHNQKLEKQQSKLDIQQAEIENTVEYISKIVKTLKGFKEKLESYEHITDIDKIWDNCKTIQNEMQIILNSVAKLSKKTAEDIAYANNINKTLAEQVNQDICTFRNETNSFKERFSDLSEMIGYTADLLDNQIPIIKETSDFAERLKILNHLDDVDSMWDYVNEVDEDLNAVKINLQNIGKYTADMQERVDKIESFISTLNSYAHLHDIDNMWADLEFVKANIKKINEDIKSNSDNIQNHQNKLNFLDAAIIEQSKSIGDLYKKLTDAEEYAVNSRNSIIELDAFKTKVTALQHLLEIDDVWKQTEDHTLQLAENRKRDKELSTTIQNNKDEADKKIEDVIQLANTAVDSLTKRVKYAYLIAGGSAGLAIVELILLLMKVI